MEHSINWHNCAWQLGDYIMNQLFQNLYIRLITVAMDCSHWWSVLNSHLITLPGLRHGEGLLCWEQQQDGSVCWTGWERRWWMRSTGGPALPRRLSRGDESPTRVYIVRAAGEIKISRVFRGEKGHFKKFFYPQQIYIFCINIHVWRHNTHHEPHTNYQPHGPQPSVWALQGVDMTGQNTSRMFTEMRGDVSSNSRMCQTYVTCTLLPTKNKSLVLCHPIVLAPVFVFILPRYKNFVLYCSSFIPAQLLCYRTQRTTTITSQSHILLVK